MVVVALSGAAAASAGVPQIINCQGRVSLNATNFDGTGQFKFALVDGTGATTYWSNGNSTVSVPVAGGLYSVLLGDTTVPNMGAIPGGVFTNTDVRLRIWFDGGLGSQQLSPDQRLSAVGYALMASGVTDGVITSSKLATGAVTTVAIANNAITTANIATGAITSINIASNTITAANMAPGAGVVPTSAIVLSQTATNNALAAAGFAPLISIANNLSGGGSNWLQVTSSAQWSGRGGHAAVALNGKVWVYGGSTPGAINDVWSSIDGTNWTQVTGAAPWSARYQHSAVVFNGKMWVLGGANGNSYYNDVWSSLDGASWTQVTSAAPWSTRAAHTAVV